MPWELRVALRYLTARRKQAFISLISGVAVLGVAVGVMALLIALGLMTGLQSEIRARILGATAHVSVFRTARSRSRTTGRWSRRCAACRASRAPRRRCYGKVLLTSGRRRAVATLKGIVPAEERTVTDVWRRGARGAARACERAGRGPAAGAARAARSPTRLNVGVGDVVTVTSPRGRLSPIGMLPRVTRLRVAGTVRTGLYEFDAALGYLPLAAAQRLFDDARRARPSSRCGSTTCSR